MFTIWAKKAKENLTKVNKKVENQPITTFRDSKGGVCRKNKLEHTYICLPRP